MIKIIAAVGLILLLIVVEALFIASWVRFLAKGATVLTTFALFGKKTTLSFFRKKEKVREKK